VQEDLAIQIQSSFSTGQQQQANAQIDKIL
jgi:hypothetical protein